MKVFVFDLLPYAEHLDHLKAGGKELPWPLPRRHFDPTVAVRTYSIEVAGESPRLNEDIPMSVSRNVSADPRYGAERFNEAARLVASDAIERVRAYWSQRRQ